MMKNMIFSFPIDSLREKPIFKSLNPDGHTIPSLFSSLPDFVIRPLSLTRPPATVTYDVYAILWGQNTIGSSNSDGRASSHRTDNRERSERSMGGRSGVFAVKEEDVPVTIPAGSDQPSDNATDAFRVLRQAMSRYGHVYDSPMHQLVELHGDGTGTDLKNKVDLVLTDPPYNTRREAGRPNSSHDEFTLAQMSSFCDEMADLLLGCGHGHIFCSPF